MDTDGITIVWNRGVEEMKGYTSQEAIGSPLSMPYTDEKKAQDKLRFHFNEAKESGFFKEEA